MSNRNNQKQIWADKMFIQKLEEIRAKAILEGKPIKNVGEITKRMCQTEAFKELEKQVINFDPLNLNKKNNMKLRIKFDGLL